MQCLIAEDATSLLGFCLDSFVGDGDRVAIFGPAPQDHTSLILNRDGLLYVDCGRHYNWAPRIDALEMVLADGVKVFNVHCVLNCFQSCRLLTLEKI